MNTQKLTKKSIEAIENAQSIAVANSNQQIDQPHVLSALLEQEEGLIPQLLQAMGADVSRRRCRSRRLTQGNGRRRKTSGKRLCYAGFG